MNHRLLSVALLAAGSLTAALCLAATNSGDDCNSSSFLWLLGMIGSGALVAAGVFTLAAAWPAVEAVAAALVVGLIVSGGLSLEGAFTALGNCTN